MELERLPVDEPDVVMKLSGEPREYVLQALGFGLFFAFGPNNSWVLDCPTATVSFNIPEELWVEVFHRPIENERIARPYWIALGPYNAWHIGYKSCDTLIHRVGYLAHYEPLREFLSDKPGRGKGIHVAFGPGDTFFACDPLSKRFKSSREMPQLLRNMLSANNNGKTPSKVALGVNNTFVVLWSDGKFSKDLRGYYQQLEQELIKAENYHKTIQFVALNPFAANQFFIDFGNYDVIYSLPRASTAEVTNALEESKNSRIPGVGALEFHSLSGGDTVGSQGSYAAYLSSQEYNAVPAVGTTTSMPTLQQVDTGIKVATAVAVCCCLADTTGCCCAVM